jgi:hypothetical protein
MHKYIAAREPLYDAIKDWHPYFIERRQRNARDFISVKWRTRWLT